MSQVTPKPGRKKKEIKLTDQSLNSPTRIDLTPARDKSEVLIPGRDKAVILIHGRDKTVVLITRRKSASWVSAFILCWLFYSWNSRNQGSLTFLSKQHENQKEYNLLGNQDLFVCRKGWMPAMWVSSEPHSCLYAINESIIMKRYKTRNSSYFADVI